MVPGAIDNSPQMWSCTCQRGWVETVPPRLQKGRCKAGVRVEPKGRFELPASGFTNSLSRRSATPPGRLPLRHRIRWIERVPLGTLYGAVVERIAAVAEGAREWGSTMLVLDATGVGRPVVDLLKQRTSVPIRAVTFTSGSHETQPEFDVHRVPKVDLVTSLEAVLQARRIECAPDVLLQDDLAAELSTFDFSMSGTGHASFEAASGSHDDLVCALMLAVWWAERPNLGDAFSDFLRLAAKRT